MGLVTHWSLCPQFCVNGLHLSELFQNHNSSILDSAFRAGMFKASGAILLTRRISLVSYMPRSCQIHVNAEIVGVWNRQQDKAPDAEASVLKIVGGSPLHRFNLR